MARLARAEVFDPSEVAIVHVMSRTIRRCFLLGKDPLTQRNFDHRRDWIESKLKQLSACMGIDLLAFSLMSNHMHLVLRSRPDIVALWSDDEVARRWLLLCPKYKRPRINDFQDEPYSREPTESELNTIRLNPSLISRIRSRLSDISWWMRLLCQNIAQRANREEGEGLGKFWQSRFKAVRILDEESLLACAAYVDLNPIRAATALTLETSEHTSVKRRIQAFQEQRISPNDQEAETFLAPLEICETGQQLGPQPSASKIRCSDKGFLSMSNVEYFELLDWLARRVDPKKRGSTPESVPPVLKRLGLCSEVLIHQVRYFGQMYSSAAGQPRSFETYRSLRTARRYYVRPLAREIFAMQPEELSAQAS